MWFRPASRTTNNATPRSNTQLFSGSSFCKARCRNIWRVCIAPAVRQGAAPRQAQTGDCQQVTFFRWRQCFAGPHKPDFSTYGRGLLFAQGCLSSGAFCCRPQRRAELLARNTQELTHAQRADEADEEGKNQASMFLSDGRSCHTENKGRTMRRTRGVAL